MKPELILQSDILDILFENRNKEYGAYELRRSYNRSMKKSVSGMLIIVCIFAVLMSWNGKPDHNSILPISDGDTLEWIVPELPPPPPPPTPPPLQVPRTIEHVTFQLTRDGSDTLPTVEALAEPVEIGTANVDGDPTDVVQPVTESPVAGSGSVPESPAAPVQPFVVAEEMPSFPGGEQALRRFLNKNLRVPEEEMTAGKRIVVRSRFVVDTLGNVTDIELIQSGGNKFDEEVKRVLNKMPKWKPGRQNGKLVPVYFVVPVVFQGEEE